MVFPTFFNFSLNLVIRSSWSKPQSAPSLVFADCIEILYLVQATWMPERRILGGGWTYDVSFWPFLNSSSWWTLISSVLLTRTSCRKTIHANSYYDAWPGWAVSISVLPLTRRSLQPSPNPAHTSDQRHQQPCQPGFLQQTQLAGVWSHGPFRVLCHMLEFTPLSRFGSPG